MPYIGKSPHFGVRNRFIYTASGSETSKSGADDNGATLTFTDGAYVDVYLNGVLLKPDTDYVTSTANTIGSLSALSTSDILEVIVYDVFSVSDTVSAASGGTFVGNVTMNGTLDVAGNVSLDGGSFIFNESSADVDFRVESNGQTHKLFVDGGNDVVCLGLATPETIGGQMPGLQIEGTDYKGGQVSIWRNGNDDAGGYLILGKSRGTALNSDTIVQDGDDVGIINFIGADGGDREHPLASIRGAVDGTPGSNDMPGRLEFWTTADGGTTLTERMVIKADGDTGIGTNAPAMPLHVKGGSSNGTIRVEHASNGAYVDNQYDGVYGSGHTYISAGGDTAVYIHTNGTQRMKMDSGRTDLAHELRIDTTSTGAKLYVRSTTAAGNTCFLEGDSQDDGHTLVCYTNTAHSGNCLRVYQDGTGSDGYTSFFHTDASTSVMYINRNGGDGVIVAYAQGGTVEGSVSISGSTTSFNAFTGSHWSRLIDNSKPTILRGTVVETLDEMCDWYHLAYTIPPVLYTKDDLETQDVLYTDEKTLPDGKKIGDVQSVAKHKVGDEHFGSRDIKEPYAKPDNKNVGDKVNHDHEGKGVVYEATIEKTGDVKHVMCKISDTADCTNVYGVFMSWDNDDDSVNDMYVNAVGTSLVRIHKDQTVSKGDLLTSNGDGTAKKQSDDIIRSKTLGKVLSNKKQETYDDGSYTVPCALYCG